MIWWRCKKRIWERLHHLLKRQTGWEILTKLQHLILRFPIIHLSWAGKHPPLKPPNIKGLAAKSLTVPLCEIYSKSDTLRVRTAERQRLAVIRQDFLFFFIPLWLIKQLLVENVCDKKLQMLLVKWWRWKISRGYHSYRLEGPSLSLSVTLLVRYFAWLDSRSEWYSRCPVGPKLRDER